MKHNLMKLAIAAALLVATGSAFATKGGEGNNTGCNGQGNPNSPCQGKWRQRW